MRIGRLPLLRSFAILILFSVGGGGYAHADSLPDGVQALDQGWNDEQRSWWYTASQGSRLLPLDWMQALETSGSTEAFLSPANVARLGYLPNPVSVANPLGLPVGFAVDQDKTRSADLMCDTFPAACDALTMRKPWVGLNCSACHTNEIVYQDKRIRVDGASTLADFQAFEEELLASLKATLDDRAKFDRFARKVLKNEISVESRASLESQLREQIAWQQLLADKNSGKVRYGHGRLDAQGIS